MFNSQFIAKQGSKSIQRIQVSRPRLRLRVGAKVQIPDGREAFVQFIRISPYWPEEKQGIKRAYVYSASWDQEGGARWTDYCLLDEMVVIG